MAPSLRRATVPTRMAPLRLISAILVSAALTACGSERAPYDDKTVEPVSDGGATTPPSGHFEGGTDANVSTKPKEIHEVFGHSDTTLFRLDPQTKVVTEVGAFNGDGCTLITDIALDEKSTLWASSKTSLFKVDKTTAACTFVADGLYPNSLSFVPKGTVDPDVEALVGYERGDYVRIDTVTGAKTKIGELGGGFLSSGDIVSVKGGKTYLTVKGASCTKTDCLVEVDPANGSLVRNWKSIEHEDVFGLSFWGGNVYGFDKTGELFEVTFGTSSITTTTIDIPSKPDNLSFWGAGSSTSVPLVPPPQ